MTRQEAIDKVAKLQRMAGSSNPHEAESARKRVSELTAKYGLTDADLAASRTAAAYDDLVDELEKILKMLPVEIPNTPSVARQVVDSLKSASEGSKSSRLKVAATVIRTAGFFVGSDPTYVKVKFALDGALRRHDVTL